MIDGRRGGESGLKNLTLCWKFPPLFVLSAQNLEKIRKWKKQIPSPPPLPLFPPSLSEVPNTTAVAIEIHISGEFIENCAKGLQASVITVIVLQRCTYFKEATHALWYILIWCGQMLSVLAHRTRRFSGGVYTVSLRTLWHILEGRTV